MELSILSVNIGQPKLVMRLHGEDIFSAIDKQPVDTDYVHVARLGIDGDVQADLSVHGGPSKAVYAFPSEHWPWWNAHGFDCRPGTFGENLTVHGADETSVHIGDRFRWGDVILQITQARTPCFKFRIHTGRKDAPALMALSGRTGWYLRVMREGVAPVRGAKLVRIENGDGPALRDAFGEPQMEKLAASQGD